MNFACVSAAKEVKETDDEDEEIVYKPPPIQEKEITESQEVKEALKEEEEVADEEEVANGEEAVKEDIAIKAEEAVKTEENSIYEAIDIKECKEVEREETPDPLQRIAAQLHGQLQGYRADFDQFSNLMEEHRPLETEEPAAEEAQKKLSREEEISLVSTMSKQDAWSHVLSQVYEVCFILASTLSN